MTKVKGPAKRPANLTPCVLALGGLDPGGGAGLAADLRAIQRAGAFGCPVIATLTVQSTSGLRSSHPIAPRLVLAQAREVFLHQHVRAIKIGALGSAANVRAVGDWLSGRNVPSIVDVPMMPTRGRQRLLPESALSAVRKHLMNRASLITVNVPEAEALSGVRILSFADATRAALKLSEHGKSAILLKGGHMVIGDESVDLFATHGIVSEVRAKRLRLPPMHGGGCTLASLIAGRIASADGSLFQAVRWAKRVHHAALESPRSVGGDLAIVAFD